MGGGQETFFSTKTQSQEEGREEINWAKAVVRFKEKGWALGEIANLSVLQFAKYSKEIIKREKQVLLNLTYVIRGSLGSKENYEGLLGYLNDVNVEKIESEKTWDEEGLGKK